VSPRESRRRRVEGSIAPLEAGRTSGAASAIHCAASLAIGQAQNGRVVGDVVARSICLAASRTSVVGDTDCVESAASVPQCVAECRFGRSLGRAAPSRSTDPQ
jgi:hypothetical protein